MTQKQKRVAITVGIIVIIVIVLLWLRKASGVANNNTINNQGGLGPLSVSIPNVTIPSLNIPQRSPIAINIPGLPSASPYDFNAISPCMCNGVSTAPIEQRATPLIGYTINEGNSGPNVYNYNYNYSATPVQQTFTPYSYSQHTFAEAHGI